MHVIKIADFKKYRSEPLFRNSIFNMLNLGANAVFGLLFWTVAVRLMPSHDVGIVTAVTSVAMFIVYLSTLGLEIGIMRQMPLSDDKNSLYNGTRVISLVLALVITLVFIAGLEFFSPSLVFLRDGASLIIFAGFVLVYLSFYLQTIVMMAIRRADMYFYQGLLLGLRIVLLYFLYFIFHDVTGVLLMIAISYLVATIFGHLVLYRNGFRLMSKIDWGRIKEISGYSLGNHMASIFALAPASIIPVIIINIAGATANAYFFIAYTITQMMMMIPSAIASSLFVEGSHDMPLGEIVYKSLKLLTLLTIPIFLVTMIFGDKVLLVFSSEYSEQSFRILQVLTISSVFSALTMMYITIKKIQKDIGIINVIYLTLSISTIGLSYVFLNAYGLIGVGYAWLVSNFAAFLIIVWLAVKRDRWIVFDTEKMGLVSFNIR